MIIAPFWPDPRWLVVKITPSRAPFGGTLTRISGGCRLGFERKRCGAAALAIARGRCAARAALANPAAAPIALTARRRNRRRLTPSIKPLYSFTFPALRSVLGVPRRL